MARRFSRLEWAIKNDATGTAFDNYKAFKAGTRKITVDRSGSLPEQYVTVYLNPFGVPAEEEYVVGYSKRSADQKGTLFTTPSLLNHNDTPTDSANVNDGKYIPAKATVHTRGTGSTNKPSGITGVPYNKRNGATSYTFPFGGKGSANATKLYVPVCRAIEEDVKKKVRQSVSFTPEKF
jgi:hypothetical protein